jgi:hypothetical protein
MNDYKIRIPSYLGSAAITSAASYFNDDAAIRSAQRLAGNRSFEVWRGLDRIYPTRAKPNRTPRFNQPVA